eukprot:CAMPEP_0119348550 /NCGR_PEP_ID=MMETSP1333-20130426/109104_1 /TAXON_ID=418940 /ORGANISM="Scyphosphaera apsteinii, Strain RCC1455" /LENGTH=63 /DNA_ID=CAMNT_0007361141 /DNA_START=518 /DNA_END=709 /DNA_ORIENTATION=+
MTWLRGDCKPSGSPSRLALSSLAILTGLPNSRSSFGKPGSGSPESSNKSDTLVRDILAVRPLT